jgi:hypothetical protein
MAGGLRRAEESFLCFVNYKKGQPFRDAKAPDGTVRRRFSGSPLFQLQTRKGKIMMDKKNEADEEASDLDKLDFSVSIMDACVTAAYMRLDEATKTNDDVGVGLYRQWNRLKKHIEMVAKR